MRRFTTECDGGSLRLGDAAGTFAICVPNGRSDGSMNVVVVNAGPNDGDFRPHGVVNHNQFRFVGTVEGAFQVYGYDCDDLSASEADLKGKYAIYVSNGTVVLERWR